MTRCRTPPCGERWTRGERWSCSCFRNRAFFRQVPLRTTLVLTCSGLLVLNEFRLLSCPYSSGYRSLPDPILRHLSHQVVSAAEDPGGPAEDHADGHSLRCLGLRRLGFIGLPPWTFWISVRRGIWKRGAAGRRRRAGNSREPRGPSRFPRIFEMRKSDVSSP